MGSYLFVQLWEEPGIGSENSRMLIDHNRVRCSMYGLFDPTKLGRIYRGINVGRYTSIYIKGRIYRGINVGKYTMQYLPKGAV